MVRRLTFVVGGLCVVLFAYFVLSDRLTPFTSRARVKGLVVPVAADVSGYVDEIAVANNQRVEAGQQLLQINRARYEVALAQAEGALADVKLQLEAGQANIASSEARVSQAKTNYEFARIQVERLKRVGEKGGIAQINIDQVEAALANAEAQVVAAEADLRRVRTQLGPLDETNPTYRKAKAGVEKAELDLTRTRVVARRGGRISDLRVDVGHFAGAGAPLMTLVTDAPLWVEAYLTENNLGRVEVGDRVEVSFDVLPGEIYVGEVVGFGGGAKDSTSNLGQLPTVSAPTGWLREPQRFPVIVALAAPPAEGRLRLESQADLVIYAGDSGFMDILARWRIRAGSLLSYAR